MEWSSSGERGLNSNVHRERERDRDRERERERERGREGGREGEREREEIQKERELESKPQPFVCGAVNLGIYFKSYVGSYYNLRYVR